MSRIPGIRRLVRLASGRSTVDADIDDELAFHFAATIDDLVKRGMSPDAARREAERRFGDVRATRQRLQAIDGSARRRLLLRERLGALALDLRMAARGLRRAPALAIAIVLTLALGLGANATMFGIVDRLLLRPPAHVADADRTGRLWIRRPTMGGDLFTGDYVGYASFDAMRVRAPALSHLAAVSPTERTLGRGEGARNVRVAEVSGDFFRLMRVRPLVGRLLGPADDRPEAPPAIVLSWESWQADHGGAASVVGSTLHVDGRPFTVVGVAPRGFTGADLSATTAWLPMAHAGYEARLTKDWRTNYDWTWLYVVGRLAPGATREGAEAQLTAAYRWAMAGEHQTPVNRKYFAEARVLFGDLLQQRGPNGTDEARVALWLAGVAGIVLLIACANVANLLLARAVQREREVAVQLALGAAPARLVRQCVAEGALLSLGGGVAALLVSMVGGGALARLLLPDVAWDRGPVDGRVLLATAAALVLTTLLVTLSPVLQARRVAVNDALRAGGRGSTARHSAVRTTLTIAQAALSVLLLVGAGLFVRSLRQARDTDWGWDVERIAFATADLNGAGWTPERTQAFWQQARERIAAIPGVAGASVSPSAPFMSFWNQDLFDEARDSLPRHRNGPPYLNAVTPEYFGTMGMRVRRGRDLAATDVKGAPRVAVVSEAMARTVWPGQEALGKCFRIGADTNPCTEVVGIAADARIESLRDAPARQYFVPLAQLSVPPRHAILMVRSASPDARALVPTIQRALVAMDPSIPHPDVGLMQGMVDPQLRPWRLGATLFSAFGLLALAVAAVGLYGVLAYDVAQRTRELGVRAALGARRGDVVWLVMRRGMTVAAVGIALGVGASLLAARWIGALLFEVPARDPVTIGAVAATLLVVAAVASLLPAWRAARVSPQAALRAE